MPPPLELLLFTVATGHWPWGSEIMHGDDCLRHLGGGGDCGLELKALEVAS